MVTITALIVYVVLAGVLLSASKIDALRGTPRSRFLSFAGGAAVAYVFLKLFQELARAQQEMAELHELSGWMRHHLLLLVAVLGAVAFYGVERGAKTTKALRKEKGEEERSAAWVFVLHHLLLSIYMGLIGYLLFREGERSLAALSAFGGIMAVHFCGVAVALDEDYRSLQMRFGRWILIVALLAGAVVGYGLRLPKTLFHLVLGVVAGAVVFSVFKEEIPAEQRSSFWAFALGVGGAVLVLWLAG